MTDQSDYCQICECSNGHSLFCPTMGIVPVLDLQATKVIEQQPCNCGWQPPVCAYPYCEHGAVDAARDANQ